MKQWLGDAIYDIQMAAWETAHVARRLDVQREPVSCVFNMRSFCTEHLPFSGLPAGLKVAVANRRQAGHEEPTFVARNVMKRTVRVGRCSIAP